MNAEDRVAAARRVLALLDLTNLNDTCTEADVIELCRRARNAQESFRVHPAAVCVWPQFVSTARRAVSGLAIHVATVVNFPQGGTDVDDIVSLTRRCLEDGADEIDCVLPYRAFLDGDADAAARVLTAVHEAIAGRAHLKVILETGELRDPRLIAAAARLAIESGADFIKTSTGKTPVSATPDAARAMLEVIATSDRAVGLKPSGGIRTLDDALVYVRLADEIMGPHWATPATFRFGASGLLDDLESVIT